MIMKLGAVYVLLALLVAFLWGAAVNIHKTLLDKMDHVVVMLVGGFFYFSAVLIYSYLNRYTVMKDWTKLNTYTISLIAINSILSGFLAGLIYFYVLKKSDSYIVSALVYSSPVFTLLIAYFVLRERVTWRGFLGVLLITVGIIMIALNESGKVEPGLVES
jgi:drug/metabolite transporter (DMT)-like permease